MRGIEQALIPQRVQRLKEKHRIDFLLWPNSKLDWPYPVVFRNRLYSVYML